MIGDVSSVRTFRLDDISEWELTCLVRGLKVYRDKVDDASQRHTLSKQLAVLEQLRAE